MMKIKFGQLSVGDKCQNAFAVFEKLRDTWKGAGRAVVVSVKDAPNNELRPGMVCVYPKSKFTERA